MKTAKDGTNNLQVHTHENCPCFAERSSIVSLSVQARKAAFLPVRDDDLDHELQLLVCWTL